MIGVEQARQQAKDLTANGDPTRAIVVMTTPFKLACLNLHLSVYADTMKSVAPNDELISILIEIQYDLQKVVTQILQQEFPQT